jgi:hypothetical protein
MWQCSGDRREYKFAQGVVNTSNGDTIVAP